VRQSLNSAKQWFRFHHHTRAAAKRTIINLMMAVKGEIAQIVDMQFQQIRFYCPPNNAKFKDPTKYLRKYRNDVEPHNGNPTVYPEPLQIEQPGRRINDDLLRF
jgi:hypothetical protein